MPACTIYGISLFASFLAKANGFHTYDLLLVVLHRMEVLQFLSYMFGCELPKKFHSCSFCGHCMHYWKEAAGPHIFTGMTVQCLIGGGGGGGGLVSGVH